MVMFEVLSSQIVNVYSELLCVRRCFLFAILGIDVETTVSACSSQASFLSPKVISRLIPLQVTNLYQSKKIKGKDSWQDTLPKSRRMVSLGF